MEPSSIASRGFTLIEMMVVLAIIATITAMALFGQQDFNRSLLLTDTAYTIALSSRDAQSRGLSSRRYIAGGQDVQNAGYGIHFDFTAPGQYLMFADTRSVTTPLANCPRGTSGTPEAKPGNCIYETTGNPTDGIVQTFTFNRGFTFYDLCGTQSGTTNTVCARASELTQIHIVFVRPNTETVITGKTPAGSYIALDNAKIYLQSQDGSARRGICFTAVGQVSVVQGTCP